MKTQQWIRLMMQLLIILQVISVSLRMSRPSSPLALRSSRQSPHCVHSSSTTVASLRSGVQEQSRGTTDVRRNTASTARFLLKLWDCSVGRVWTALINVVKGIFGKKNEPFGSKDSPVKFLSEERTSVLPPIANAALTEAAAFDEDRVSVRQKENLLEARRFMEQKLREIDGRPRRVVAGLQLEMSNQEAADAAEDVGGDGILPSTELTTAMPMNGPDEDTTAPTEYGAINALAAMPENDTSSAVGYGAFDALANIPEEDVIAVSEVTSDAVINGMFVCCCDVIVSAI